jgi:diacylglycerol kinase family enzyme
MLLKQVRTAIVKSAGEIEYHLDGEPGVAEGRAEITVRPGALLVKA